MDLYSIAALSTSKEVTLPCNAKIVALAPSSSVSKLVTLSYNIVALAITLLFFFDEEEAFAKAFSSLSMVSVSSLSSP